MYGRKMKAEYYDNKINGKNIFKMHTYIWKPPKHEVVRENILESIEKKSVSIGNFCLFCILYNPIKMRKEKKEEKKKKKKKRK